MTAMAPHWQLLLVSVFAGLIGAGITGLAFASDSGAGVLVILGSTVSGLATLGLFVALIAIAVDMGVRASRR